jgi:hypothetical protein
MTLPVVHEAYAVRYRVRGDCSKDSLTERQHQSSGLRRVETGAARGSPFRRPTISPTCPAPKVSLVQRVSARECAAFFKLLHGHYCLD